MNVDVNKYFIVELYCRYTKKIIPHRETLFLELPKKSRIMSKF